MNIFTPIHYEQFRSRPRILRMAVLGGGILLCCGLLFPLLPRSINFPRSDYFNYLIIFLVGSGAFINALYFLWLLINTPALLMSHSGLILKSMGKHYSATWSEIEKLTIVHMEIKGKSVLYTGQKLLIVSQGKHIGTINSFEIGNFEELVEYLAAMKLIFTNKIFIPRQFHEKTFITYLYTIVIWTVLLFMINSVFLSPDSKYFLFS